LYNELYELWKREKENKLEIGRLSGRFYSKIISYIKKLKEENRMLDKKTTKAKLLNNELKNVKLMIEELVLLRYNKLQNNIFFERLIPRDDLVEEEKKFYNDILPIVESYNTFLRNILAGRLLLNNITEKKNIILRFIQEIPALIGVDMKTYGPFLPEDIASLPFENAKILLKQGIAVQVELN
jgi:DNA replication factor GINS